ncbi:MAG TPA: carboxyl transferase domain-containing protein [Caulobacteraceae bacterium]|jgi:acetyl/propionyl-CoA carboxylase alpha subunit/acetyl-CoA carboxylase carboxyltransferase component|nr:carboxyl transferase domain-containing protein [Caulobacteraceae bacterium]
MFRKLLIANRGEIAVRIARTATDMGIATVSVAPQDDANSLHTRASDETVVLQGAGAGAYLDIDQLVAAAVRTGCDSVHPGYGFLSENPRFATGCATAGLTFVGPSPEQLALFGDKARARALAKGCGVPVLPGTEGPTSLAEARAFLESLGEHGAIMLKAIAGGGGRGIRQVDRLEDLAPAFELCASESLRAFGNGELYVEQVLGDARHLEVQALGDGSGAVSHLWDRECSLQRRRQKIIEIAPAVGISDATRERSFEAASLIARAVGLRNLATFEFLVDQTGQGEAFVFMEANPRLQVEHTVTEAVMGMDLVALQLRLAAGASLENLGLAQADIPRPRGSAVQARVNMETMQGDGSAKPASGVLAAYEPPAGPGVRVDGFGYAGYRTSTNFDSLLAKVIVHVPDGTLADAMHKASRALSEFKITGVPTNIAFLQRLVSMPEVGEGRVNTRFIEDHRAALTNADGAASAPRRYFEPARGARLAGATIDRSDPLAILDRGLGSEAMAPTADGGGEIATPDGCVAVLAPLQGAIVSTSVAAGELVLAGRPVLVMEAMKMEHLVLSEHTGILREFTVRPGDAVYEGAALAFIEPRPVEGWTPVDDEREDIEFVRADLAELQQRRQLRADATRTEAVERRHARGQRTARENIDDLCDPGSFVELGGLAVAARRQRHSLDELVRNTPADGFIMGTARVNGDRFADERARCAVMAYDPTVLAGTQGMKGHEKLDRMLELAAKSRLPVVFFTEGGGGRPGDTDKLGVGYNFIRTFSLLGQLSGLVPLVGVTNSRCFAGNAFILGCCDVVIATQSSTIGIAGPALIEGAGLGAYRPEEIGPVSMQAPNGVIDVLVADEAAAVAAAKRYLGYFQGPLAAWSHADQRLMRSVVPENRRRVYDMRKLIAILADTDTVMELRPQFGAAIITALIRIEGRAIGVIANNPHHLGGAIDSAGSDKATRFMQLCEAYDLPILSLCDTPGYMVGPSAEQTALIRHCARMIVIGSNLTVPMIAIVVRKGYGLGGLAMAGGSFSNCIMTAAWPTGEFGGMALEGFVKLGFRDQLAAIEDLGERQAKYEEMVAQLYEDGKALNAATFYEFDDVIDPQDTRQCIVEALRSSPPPRSRDGKKLPWIDTW